ncbi:coiled-coil domain-containing protein 116 [Candoia aspera]|uniref:coiled-coil domain-containing protein 116 n=1 Tax=Candoia aspera TaxID=51853 RepID=UPI002FD85945
MENCKYSGYLADDESFRRPQDRHVHTSPRRSPCDWRTMPRPPSRCQFRTQCSPSSTRTFNSFSRADQGKRKRRQSSSSSSSNGRTIHLANEFSEFVDFLADEEVLDSLQLIVEDAVRKLRDVTTQSGEPVFGVQEDSPSSVDSESWSYSYSSTCSRVKYQTTATSSSEDDQEKRFVKGGQSKPGGKVSLLDKYIARLPKAGKKAEQELSGGIHTESFSERSGDSFFQLEHLHVWAKLAESFGERRQDYFASLRKALSHESFSLDSLHKEITSVLKRPTPRCIPLYYTCQEPFQALDFLEENKILAALQDIINQAVLKVLEATMTDGIPFVTLFDERGYPVMPWELSEEGSGSEGSGSGDESSGEGEEETIDGKKRKGKKKKKESGGEQGQSKYAPPHLPKSKQKSIPPEEPARKPKYTPPPFPKTKPRAPPEEPPPKPKYTPPPLPKPKQKKPDASQTETETTKSTILTKDIITRKDIKRARLQARPLPKQSIIDFLIENAAKLILYKFNYETLLAEKLGFISVPVTKVLLEIMFGYKKVKGSGIRLSSQIDWTKVYDEVYKKRPPKPKVPKPEEKKKKKKKGGDNNKKKDGDKKKPDEKKTVLLKSPEMPKGKVVMMKLREGTESNKTGGPTSITAQGEPDIFEIVPPQFPADAEHDQTSADENGFTYPSSSRPLVPTSPESMKASNPRKSGDPPLEESSSALGTPRHSKSSRKTSTAPQSNRGSTGRLPGVESAGQLSDTQVKKSVSHRSSFAGEGSKTVLPKI